MQTPIILIHGGAGTLEKRSYSEKEIHEYVAKLKESLKIGYEVLSRGGSALEAVCQSVVIMEDSELFNAGRGAVLNHNGFHELDASLMDGRTKKVGAVASLTNIKNPILAARKVLEHSPHSLLIGEGAENFALEHQLTKVKNDYFTIEKRKKQLIEAKKKNIQVLDHDEYMDEDNDGKTGTVGAVACDQDGNIASATSTGGITNKAHGRVSDSSVIGAGTFASNNTCAISCTGTGDQFIQNVVAHDISAQMEYGGISLNQACARSLNKLLGVGGFGGVIAVTSRGQFVMDFNSRGMFRGVYSEHEKYVSIFKDGRYQI